MAPTHTRDGWHFVEGGRPNGHKTVLLLPGLLCTDLIYEDMLADPAMHTAGIRMLAGNPPGFKGQPVPAGFDFRVESYAALVEDLCRDLKVDLLVGHSFFGNVAIEVGARHAYEGKVMLISPSLHRRAEPNDTRTLDAMSRRPLLSSLTWWATWLMLPSIFKPYFTAEKADRLAAVVADAKRTPRPVARRLLLSLFDYIDAREDLTARLLMTRQETVYLRGAEDNIGFTDAQRQAIAAAPLLRIVDVPKSRHFAMLDQPHAVNRIIREQLGLQAPTDGDAA